MPRRLTRAEVERDLRRSEWVVLAGLAIGGPAVGVAVSLAAEGSLLAVGFLALLVVELAMLVSVHLCYRRAVAKMFPLRGEEEVP